MAAAEIAAGEMSPAEVRTGEVPAKMHASEMAAPKSAKMAKSAKVAEPAKVSATKAAEMTKAAKVPEPAKVSAAKVPEPAKMSAAKAASEAATSKGKGVAHRALKAEPEREHHRENLRRPTDHRVSPALRVNVVFANAWAVPRVP